VGSFNTIYDHTSPSSPVQLPSTQTRPPQTTTQKDPFLMSLSKLGDKRPGNIYATDELLAALMGCTRSVYHWQLFFTRTPEGVVYIDKPVPSILDYYTMNEYVFILLYILIYMYIEIQTTPQIKTCLPMVEVHLLMKTDVFRLRFRHIQ
jgi:hypothetical protein